MKTRLKRVPATTNNITTAVINFLNSKGHLAVRINTTGIYDPVNQIFRMPDANSLGCPDIIACLRFDGGYEETRHGQFIGIEIKNKLTSDRMRKNQLGFHKRISDSNGLSIVIHSYQEFLDWYAKATPYHLF